VTRRLLAAALLGLLLPATARAYLRQVTSNGTPIAWKSGCVFITPDAHGSKNLTPQQTFGEITNSTTNWTNVTGACSYMQFRVDSPTSGRKGGLDGTNLIIWLEDKWGRTGTNGQFTPYSPDAPALTTIFFVDDAKRADNGTILDADTELNGVGFTFAIIADGGTSTCSTSNCMMDVQNTLTHELGHMLGLDHTCWVGDPTMRPLDSNGQPVPLCGGALPPAVTDATMYNFACCGETKKRTPEADDIAGICGIYPIAQDPHMCQRAQTSGGDAGCSCALGRGPGGLGALAAALLCAGLATARVCSRSRRRSRCGADACDRPPASDAA
jgi:hypothetical protein